MNRRRLPIPRALALRAIDAYQLRLSPHKGYRCAYAATHGGSGCSGAVRDLIARRGLRAAVRPSLARLWACTRVGVRPLLRRLTASPLPAAAGGSNVEGVCCLGCIPIPFRF